jgi:hypothetical protein
MSHCNSHVFQISNGCIYVDFLPHQNLAGTLSLAFHKDKFSSLL